MTEDANPDLLSVLTIDGGGARGIVPAVMIREIERLCCKPVHELFDVVSGASTGAVIALLTTRPDPYSGEKLVRMYKERSKDFFRRDLWHSIRYLNGIIGPRFPARHVEQTMRDVLGEDTKMSDALTEVIIPMFDLRLRWPRVLFLSRRAAHGLSHPRFRNDPQAFFREREGEHRELDIADGTDEKHDFLMWQVARAATAAPIYFPGYKLTSLDEPKTTYHPLDGGVFMNNPLIEGIVYGLKHRPESKLCAVSLGTGYANDPIRFENSKNWGLVQWAMPLLNVMFEGQAESATSQARDLEPTLNSYQLNVRFEPALPYDIPLDDTRPETLDQLEEIAVEYLRAPARQQRLDKLIAALTNR